MHIAMITGHETTTPRRTPHQNSRGQAGLSRIAAEQVRPLAEALTDRGHTVTVYTPVESDQPEITEELVPGVQLQPVAAGDPDDPRMPARYGATLEHAWQSQAPDVAHAFSWSAGLATVAAGGTTPVPLVQDYRDLTGPRPNSADGDQVARLKTALGKRAQRNIVSGTAQAIALSSHGVPRATISMVPYGVDVEVFGPDGAIASRTNHPLLVCADGLSDGAGGEQAVRALPRIPDAELVIAGSTGADLDADVTGDAHLLELADDLDVADRVNLVGDLATEELAALFRSADLVLSFPVRDCSFSACLEAMACETPVVATAVEGRDDLLVDGVSGALVSADNPHALADTVRGLLADEPRRTAYGIAGADRAAACYSFGRIAARTETAYTSAVQAGRFTGSSLAGTYRPTGR